MYKLRSENEKDIRDRRNELTKTERRLLQREETLDKKADGIEERERQLNAKQAEVEAAEEEVSKLHEKQLHELEAIAGLSTEAAKEMLLSNVEKKPGMTPRSC